MFCGVWQAIEKFPYSVYKRLQKTYGRDSILYTFLSNLIILDYQNLSGLSPLFCFKSCEAAVLRGKQREHSDLVKK